MVHDRGKFPRTLIILIVGLYCGLNTLGVWQIQRHYEKERYISRVEIKQRAPIVDLDSAMTRVAAFAAIQRGDAHKSNHFYRRVHLTGTFIHEMEMHAYPRTYEVSPGNQKAGFDVVTPFKREDGTHILINRGWVPVESLRIPGKDDGITRPEGTVTLTATILPLPRKSQFTPENNPRMNQWFRIDFAEIVAHTKLENVMPVYVLQEPYQVTGDVTPHNTDVWPVIRGYRPNIRDNHLEYALTWYLLSVALLILSITYYRNWYRNDTSEMH